MNMDNLSAKFECESAVTLAGWAVQHESIILNFDSLSAADSYVHGFQSAVTATKDIDFVRRIIKLMPRY